MTGPCPFCAIIDGDAPATVVGRWDDALAIVPLNPVTPGHVLVIPLVHVEDVSEDPAVSGAAMVHAAELAGRWPAVNVITSKGRAATQSVPHLHLHVVPRAAGDGLPLPWTPQQERVAS